MLVSTEQFVIISLTVLCIFKEKDMEVMRNARYSRDENYFVSDENHSD